MTPLNHETASDLFSAYLDAELPPPELERLEEHLHHCDTCRSGYEEFAEAITLVRDVPRLRAPRGFTRRVVKRARRSRTRGLGPAAAQLVLQRQHVEVAALILLAAALAALVIHLL
jgi:anti-sigma factor RsiW